MDRSLLDVFWILFSACLVFLMQAGFMCLEAGSTRSKNTINVVIKNIADVGLSVLCFWLFGYGLMFGHSQVGWIGTTHLAPEVGQGQVDLVVFFLFQAMFCSTAVTIVSGAVAERIRFSSYLMIALLVSGVLYPIFGHWSWNGLNEGLTQGWLGALGFVDFAGSTVVHSVGGWVALAAVIVVGPRVGRFSRKRRRPLTIGYDFPLALLGTLLLWLGWFGFNGGSTLTLNEQVPGIIANTLLAGAAGLVTPIVINLVLGQQVPVKAVMNGSLAGLVAITANCHAVSASAAILIGGIGSLCMLATDYLLERWRIDDAVGAIPVHLSAGIWGTLAVALFGDLSVLGTGLSRLTQLAVQGLGVAIAGIWTFGLTYVLLRILNRRWPLRVSRRHEHIGLNVSEHNATSDLVDLFTVMRRQERTGDLGLRAPVERFTPVGQIAARYNQVIARLERALARTDAIVANASEAILTVAPTSLRIQTANPAVRKLFGISEEQLCQQQSLTDLLDATALLHAIPDGTDGITVLRQLLEKASQDGYPYELVGRRRSGSTFPLELSASLVKTRSEWSYAVIIRDITLRKQAQEAILASEAKDLKAQQLEKALKDLQQTQLQLVHSEKMSSLGQLVAGVAHEINNPINFIYANLDHVKDYAQTLLEFVQSHSEKPVAAGSGVSNGGISGDILSNGTAPSMVVLDSPEDDDFDSDEDDLDYIADDLPKILVSMQSGAERITEIVKSLRDFSHLGGAKLKRVDIHQGLESTLTILNSRLKGRGDRPEISVLRSYGDLPKVDCYPGQLNQVFMNLLTNAIDTLEEKSAMLAAASGAAAEVFKPQILLHTEWEGGDRIRIHVVDNGNGIPDHVQKRMLDPFFTTKPVGRGNGLGMPISYQIVVDRHHGQLRWLSTANEGSRFLIELPVDQFNSETD